VNPTCRTAPDKYISATLSVYLSVYNIFRSLPALVGFADGRDE